MKRSLLLDLLLLALFVVPVLIAALQPDLILAMLEKAL